jgi:hypothetical protein
MFILPQFGIFAQGTHAHHFLEFDLRAGVSPTQAVASFRRLRMPDVSAGGVNLVIAFGADAWREVAPSARSRALMGRSRPPRNTTPGSGSVPARRM